MEDPGIVQELLKLGLPGVVLVVLGWFAWQLYKENRQVSKDRLTDSRADTDKAWAALNAAAAAQQSTADAMRQLKEVIDTAILQRRS